MELQVIQRRKTAAGYVSKLERGFLVSEGPRLCGNNWISPQDNAAIYNLFNNVIRLDHPVCSPDLNTTENFEGGGARWQGKSIKR